MFEVYLAFYNVPPPEWTTGGPRVHEEGGGGAISSLCGGMAAEAAAAAMATPCVRRLFPAPRGRFRPDLVVPAMDLVAIGSGLHVQVRFHAQSVQWLHKGCGWESNVSYKQKTTNLLIMMKQRSYRNLKNSCPKELFWPKKKECGR
ncbi:hypothetical protein BS78_03G176500 [Paspalum vaginatum]|nr:hypothetical protein BS78_03G176500 [Paspalum vaginatum]